MDTLDYKTRLQNTYLKEQLTITTGKETLEVPIRIPCFDEAVIIDAVNFVIHGSTFSKEFKETKETLIQLEKEKKKDYESIALTVQRFADYYAEQLADIFGADFLEVTYTGKGLHFYKYACTIGHNDKVLGKICFGGQRDTILTQITGAGCQFADMGWEYNLYQFLNNFAEKPKLTRIDLAHDDFDGAYLNVLDANIAETNGMFMLTNKRPTVEMLGDWKHHQGKGRTLQIGKRENGKLIRIYEKGKKFGDKDNPWCRAEIEFGAKSRHLPLEMLLSPTEYFVGAYPFTYELIDKARAYKGLHGVVFVNRIETVKKEDSISIEKSFEIWKRQAGRYLRAYRDMGLNDTFILDLLQCDKTQNFYPKRLKLTEKLLKNPPTYALRSDPLQPRAIN